MDPVEQVFFRFSERYGGREKVRAIRPPESATANGSEGLRWQGIPTIAPLPPAPVAYHRQNIKFVFSHKRTAAVSAQQPRHLANLQIPGASLIRMCSG